MIYVHKRNLAKDEITLDDWTGFTDVSESAVDVRTAYGRTHVHR